MLPCPPQHPTLDLNLIKCAVFTAHAKLLWRSPAWAGLPAGVPSDPIIEERLAGFGYQEFVDPDNLPNLIAFFAKPASSEVFTFGSVIPDTGAVGKISLTKLPYGKNWLVVGHFKPDVDVTGDVQLPLLLGFEELPPPFEKT